MQRMGSATHFTCDLLQYFLWLLSYIFPLLILALSLLPPSPLIINISALSFDYSPLNLSSSTQHLDPKGDVNFKPEYVELTQADYNSIGRVYHKDQLFLWDSVTNEVASFNSSFTFSIYNNNDASFDANVTSLLTLAFFLLDPSRGTEIPSNSSGRYLGLLNATTNSTASAGVTAVALDTFNHSNGDHISITINTIDPEGYSQLPFDIVAPGRVYCWIDYSGSLSQLEVFVSTSRINSSKPSMPVLSHAVDLSQSLPNHALIGLSATTNDSDWYTRIFAWSFNSTAIGIRAPASAPQAPLPSIHDISSSNNKSSNHVGLIAGLSSTAVLVSVTALLLLLLKKRQEGQRRRQHWLVSSGIPLSGLPSPSHVGFGPQKFDYRDLSEATNRFSDDFLLGEGGFGSVYKGTLPGDGSEVAVKCISQKSAQGEKEFFAEVSLISRIRHKNLVQLRGWCRQKNHLLLVYEYLHNSSLDRHLFSKKSSLILNWRQRYNIVCGLGSALQYLHEECEKVIVHRDIKTSNVMLDDNYNAKLGDFGLARQLGEGAEGHTTIVAGTMGYMAPESYKTGRATTYSDVYSYGIVLLEVACGRRPKDSSLPGQFDGNLLDWVWDMHSKRKLRETCDGRLGEAFDEEQLIWMLTVGLACAHPDPKSRPSIRIALEALLGRIPVPTIPSFKPVAYYGPPSLAASLSSDIGSSSSAATVSSSDSSVLASGKPGNLQNEL